ncbi:DUF3592 domain-containing protein [Maribacter polysaccharolyticus]|uniref:DUF3592 domain-containing protein n=1 Tax=Maribacter polysaccharolyticus TaxID=3020831 RepID=UPI00237F7351|nr:DUF3592 domain-containing protein [Maribacter polysaccharolyticus]MDE3743336.1 DUF3592 domain-containing protein [Maribacter polysaccharolyticus]
MRLLIKIIYIFGIATMFVFLILLVVMACYSLYKPISLITENHRYQWEESKAAIQKVELESLPNPAMTKEASMVFPLDECKIQYAYQYGGEYYTNTQIGLNKAKDYTSRFHNELYLKLKDKHQVTVYVNPKNPSQSSLLKYDIDLKDIGAGIAFLIFPLLLLHWVYISKKHPARYLADQIHVVS